MADEPSYEIEGHLFPIVTQFNHGDPILVREVTGLSWDEFADLWAEAGEEGTRENPILHTALIAVAVQHAQPTWSRKRVGDYVLNIPFGTEKIVGVDEDALTEGDPDISEGVAALVVPPADSPETSNISDGESSTPAESSSDNSASPDQNSSADPGSSTITPDLRQVV